MLDELHLPVAAGWVYLDTLKSAKLATRIQWILVAHGHGAHGSRPGARLAAEALETPAVGGRTDWHIGIGAHAHKCGAYGCSVGP
jgi:hypothetical protein